MHRVLYWGCGLEIFRAWRESQGNVHLHVVSTFYRYTDFPGKWRGLVQCLVGFASPVSDASGYGGFHDPLFDGAQGFL